MSYEEEADRNGIELHPFSSLSQSALNKTKQNKKNFLPFLPFWDRGIHFNLIFPKWN